MKPETTTHRGAQGEDLASDFLAASGYHIVKRNLRCGGGEVDIVVYKDDALTFVEVKHWHSSLAEDLSRSVNHRKRRRIIACAREFVWTHPEWSSVKLRFDVVFVTEMNIVHYRDAFTENGFE